MNINKRFKAQKYYSRLDHFLVEALESAFSRSHIAKLIQENHVKLNEKPCNRKNHEILAGDVVDMEIPQPEKIDYVPTFQLKKLYEDNYLMIIDKPSGISVHHGAGENTETILDVFRYYYPQIDEIEDAEGRPGIVHRLDKDTSGILLLAKDTITMRRLQKQFKRREITKIYLAMIAGHMRYRTGKIDAPILRSRKNRTRFMAVHPQHDRAEDGREAVTHYHVLRAYEHFSYVQLMPETGRTHQLRVHLAHTGNPVLGDSLYGKPGVATCDRLALHAYSIEFVHPMTEQTLTSFCPFPAELRRYLK